MRDWEELVRTKLASLAIEPEEKREVIAELAAHLEETCETLRGGGMPEQEAIRRALSQVPDWNDLQGKIRTARIKENNMNSRVTRFWIPGLLTFMVSMSLLAVIEKFGPKPSVLYMGDGPAVIRTTPSLIVYIPWLVALPLIGAMGAYLSNRAGASVRTVLVSSIFPIFPFIGLFSVVLPVGLIIDRQVGVTVVAASLLRLLVGWVLIPGMALLAGGLLAWLLLSRRLGSRRIVSN
jgi:hypothetical protein